MTTSELDRVLQYWDRQAEGFDAIYSGDKATWARFLDRWLRKDMYQRLAWVLEHSGDLPGRTVCDLGCGSGRFVMAYALGGARKVLGLDAAPTMIQKASELARHAGVADRCELRVLNILECPTDTVFDITLAVGVFDYLRDPGPFLSRIRQITGHRFLATFPRFWTWRMPIRKVRLGILGCPVYFYTAREIEGRLRKAGFVCTQVERLGAIYVMLAVPDSSRSVSGQP